ncbi:Extracellular ligand-binding receptor [Candidatus Terasakiella magnetica]|nr:Extracellular ligand-binding receptor [Candidatus Terasakiella magnetica]
MKKLVLAAATALICGAVQPAAAEFTGGVIKIGVLNDMSGIYSDFQGPGSVIAAQMAVEDFGGKVNGTSVEVLAADHQNKPDVGMAIARQWLDKDGVDVIMDLPNSAIALAVNEVVREKNSVFIGIGAGTDLLTGEKCSPNTVHWVYDTWADANSLARAASRAGAKSWYFVTADYAFGYAVEKQAIRAVEQEGGKVLGSVRHPLGTMDFSSFVLQAQASKAQAIGIASAGGDVTSVIKQAKEFGITQGGQKLVALIFQINSVQALGLETTQGLLTVSPFYWDQNAETRAFAKRFQERHKKHAVPNEMHAGMYSAVTHYLKSLQALGSDGDGRAVVAKMKELRTKDQLFGEGYVREDGRKMHPMHLIEVKTPAESKGEWDYFKILSTIPAEESFRPLAEGNCPMIKK